MAVCRTLKTKKGITKFLLHSEHGDESMTGFQYEGKKVEVHALKKECAPLYFDEGTKLNYISLNNIGTLLIATTPNNTNNSLEIGLWDINNSLGFTPKEIAHENKKDNKYRFLINLKKYFDDDYKEHITATTDGIMCIIVNGSLCLLCKVCRSEPTNLILFEVTSTTQLSTNNTVIDSLFLKDKEKLYLVLMDTNTVYVAQIDNGEITSTIALNIPSKISKATGLSRLHKLTYSKCLIIDNLGYLNLLTVPDIVNGLKFPTSIYGHGVCAVVGFKNTTEGILAICNENHTINLYLLADIICSVKSGVSTFVKPYRVLCTQYPINSMTFVRHDQLAMASASNELITFWGGLLNNVNQ